MPLQSLFQQLLSDSDCPKKQTLGKYSVGNFVTVVGL